MLAAAHDVVVAGFVVMLKAESVGTLLQWYDDVAGRDETSL